MIAYYRLDCVLFFNSRKKHAAQQTYPYEESIFDIMLSGPRPFTTFLVIKPRAFQRHLTKILKKLTQEGFRLVGLKLLVLDEGKAELIVPNDVGVCIINPLLHRCSL